MAVPVLSGLKKTREPRCAKRPGTGASFTCFLQQATPHAPRKEVSLASAQAKVRGGIWWLGATQYPVIRYKIRSLCGHTDRDPIEWAKSRQYRGGEGSGLGSL